MPERTSDTRTPAETEALGAEVADDLSAGDVVLVSGELGAGKTTFVRGACRALGVDGAVTSPTFTIGRRYAGRVAVSHLDLYRLSDIEHEDPGLVADYLDPDAIVFVEWPEREPGSGPVGPDLFERVALRVTLEHLGGDRRRVSLT